MAVRRLVLDYHNGAGIFWTTHNYSERRTRRAIGKFSSLYRDCVGLPQPMLFQIVTSKEVGNLPLLPGAIVTDQSPLAMPPTDSLFFYGDYGTVGKIVRWTALGVRMPDLPLDHYDPPKDINNIDGYQIGTDVLHMYRRRQRKA